MKIRLLHSEFDFGDWEGLYIDDRLILEGYQLSVESIIHVMMNYIPGNNNFASVWADDHLEEYGNRCPECWPEELE
jgi:hypothetical protein